MWKAKGQVFVIAAARQARSGAPAEWIWVSLKKGKKKEQFFFLLYFRGVHTSTSTLSCSNRDSELASNLISSKFHSSIISHFGFDRAKLWNDWWKAGWRLSPVSHLPSANQPRSDDRATSSASVSFSCSRNPSVERDPSKAGKRPISSSPNQMLTVADNSSSSAHIYRCSQNKYLI